MCASVQADVMIDEGLGALLHCSKDAQHLFNGMGPGISQMGCIPLHLRRWLANDLESGNIDSPVGPFHPYVDVDVDVVDGVYHMYGTGLAEVTSPTSRPSPPGAADLDLLPSLDPE